MTNAEVEAFLTVCETKSISRAAERLFISQSALSAKIKTLEKKIGCLLLARNGLEGQPGPQRPGKGADFWGIACRPGSGRDEI